jgi:hypothetical protein
MPIRTSDVFWYGFDSRQGEISTWVMTRNRVLPGVRIKAGESLGHLEYSSFEDLWFMCSHGPGNLVDTFGRAKGLSAAKLLLFLYCHA